MLATIILTSVTYPSQPGRFSNTVTKHLDTDIAPEALVRPMAIAVELPGQHNNAAQTSADRTASAFTPMLDDISTKIPSDPRRDEQWSFFDSQQYRGAAALFAAHEHTTGNYPIVVGVVDSGLMLNHEDLEVLPGYDFISDSQVANDGDGRDSDPSDPGDWVTSKEILQDPISSGCTATPSKWHGTAVGGIIGAISDNQRGITGGAPSVLLLPVRVTGKCGGFIKDLIDGIRWTAGLSVHDVPVNNLPARVINLSVGFSGSCPSLLQTAIDEAVQAGSIVVVAATNSASSLDTSPQSPASCANVVTVGAILQDGRLAPYSAFGTDISLLAPGGSVQQGIITTRNAGATVPMQESSYG